MEDYHLNVQVHPVENDPKVNCLEVTLVRKRNEMTQGHASTEEPTLQPNPAPEKESSAISAMQETSSGEMTEEEKKPLGK